MTHPLTELNALIREQSVAFRKGEVQKVKEVNGVKVVTIDAFPETPLRSVVVDVHFINVGFTEAAVQQGTFVNAIRRVVRENAGEFVQLSLDNLAGGPSYITLGQWLGSQQQALQFMALCEFHGLGQVITPATLGMTGDAAEQMAGSGLVMATCDVREQAEV